MGDPESGCNPVKLKGTIDPLIILVNNSDVRREYIAPVTVSMSGVSRKGIINNAVSYENPAGTKK